ncbi:MAG: DUF1353 domain-containing protein [Alphaproteobacteria bacterium]|nr:DUF1353 domain-containing protein [Alphaproteobacteria bacterium]
MSAYTGHLALFPTPSRSWRLAETLAWEIGRKGSELFVFLPPGFETDLASIPFWARSLFNPADARFAKASVLHDYLISTGWAPPSASAAFAEALAADGVGKWRASIMGLAVLAYAYITRR